MIEADLGGGLFKKRVAIFGKGKSGGYRTLIAFKRNDKAFFVYGFSKNQRANISIKELGIYKQLAKHLLGANEVQIQNMLKMGTLIEVV